MQLIDWLKNPKSGRCPWEKALPAVNLLKDRIRFFKEYYNPNVPIDILEFSLRYGPQGAELLNSWWKNNRHSWVGLPRSDAKDSLMGEKTLTYEEHFPAKFLIHWDEEVTDITDFMFTKVDVDREALESVEEEARELSGLFEEGDFNESPFDIYQPTGSGSYDPDLEVTKPEWKNEIPLWPPSYDAHLNGKRSKAPKCPGETRDILTPTPGSRWMMRHINLPLTRLIKRLPNCPYGGSTGDLDRFLSKVAREKGGFYMRDIEKCGLTVPHEVIAAVYKGLYASHPKLRDEAIRFYSNPSFVDYDGVTKFPLRGHFLGMWTEGMTILQYIIHQINLRTFSGKSIFSAVNDDNLVSFDSKKDAEDYEDVDVVTCEDLCIPLKTKKSGTSSNSFFYCEEYYLDGKKENKTVTTSLALIGGKCCINIRHAKAYTNAVIGCCGSWNVNTAAALAEVVSHWGYEFNELEYKSPYLFGGWATPYRHGLDDSINCRIGHDFESRAYFSIVSALRSDKADYGKPITVIGKLLEAKVITRPEDKFLDWGVLCGTLSTLEKKFASSINDWKGTIKKWTDIQRREVKSFSLLSSESPKTPEETWNEQHPEAMPWLGGCKLGDYSHFDERIRLYQSHVAEVSIMCDLKDGKVSINAPFKVNIWDEEFFRITKNDSQEVRYSGKDETSPSGLKVPQDAQYCAVEGRGKAILSTTKEEEPKILGIGAAVATKMPLSVCHYLRTKGIPDESIIKAYCDEYDSREANQEPEYDILEKGLLEAHLADIAKIQESVSRILSELFPNGHNVTFENLASAASGDREDGSKLEDPPPPNEEGESEGAWDILERL